jgi:2-methylisocitrate lyase-like PEP mutase family enzyme
MAAMSDSSQDMSRSLQQEKANAFRAMHRGPRILLLPNVWDVASARIVEEAGYSAIATTSAGVAFSLGYPDGERISRVEMLARVARIAKAVKLPVTADVEAGYGRRPEDAAQTAQEVIEAGAIGMNFEDAIDDPSHPLVDLNLQLERISAIRETALKAGVLLVLNARTDTYLREVGPAEARYDETVRRLVAYRDAGADCVFAPGLQDRETIRRLVADVRCPLNILAGPASPPVGELEQLGVARISLGSSPMRATLGSFIRVVDELKTAGTYSPLGGAPSHADVNRMMERK